MMKMCICFIIAFIDVVYYSDITAYCNNIKIISKFVLPL